MIEAGFFILILCLLAVITCLAVRIVRADDNLMEIHIVKCSGDCGKKVMLVGRRQEFGECVFCAKCWTRAHRDQHQAAFTVAAAMDPDIIAEVGKRIFSTKCTHELSDTPCGINQANSDYPTLQDCIDKFDNPFSKAPAYHHGGIRKLQADEVPVILARGHSEAYRIPWPEGMNWWAIDGNGEAWFFTHKPVLPEDSKIWVVPEPADYDCWIDEDFNADDYPLMVEHWRASLYKRGGV